MRARSTPPTARRLTAAAALLACLQGCAAPTPYWDTRFGNATRANLAAQVIDPAPAASAGSAAGLDGRAARAAYETYQRSFTQPEQPAALVKSR